MENSPDSTDSLKQAEARLTRRAAQLALVNQTAKQIAALSTPNEVLERAARLTRSSFDYHHVGIFLYDAPEDAWVMLAHSGEYDHIFPERHSMKTGQGMVGWAAMRGEVILANDVRSDPHYINFFPEILPTQAELSVPIRFGQDVMGILDVQSPQTNAFDEGDVMVMETLADQIAVAIENARLYDTIQQELAVRRKVEDALRASLEERELLLKEVHHRVKNNLQTISSMLSLRAEGLEDPKALQAFADCENTVQAISMVHKTLYDWGSLGEIDARNYILELTSRLLSAANVGPDRLQLQVAVESISLNMDTAIACGLVINELLTNILKHAFPSGWSSAVPHKADISMRADEANFLLVVRDNGIGLPDDFSILKTKTLGLQLVNLLVRQIKGTVDIHHEDGTQFKILFPVSQSQKGGQHARGENISGR